MRVALTLAVPVLASLLACSMSTQYFVYENLLASGLSRSEARCAVDGVSAHLSDEQLWALRGPAMSLVFESRMEVRQVDQWLDWIAPQVTPEIHHVLDHYARHCRATSRDR